MSLIYPRLEGSTGCSFFTPFEIGLRHLKVAVCDGSQDTLISLAKERNIYRPYEDAKNKYESITLGARVFHAAIGAAETVGYVTIVVPIVIALFEKIVQDLLISATGAGINSDHMNTHLQEGGSAPKYSDYVGGSSHQGALKRFDRAFRELENSPSLLRKNPFHSNGAQDPFYRGASWIPKK